MTSVIERIESERQKRLRAEAKALAVQALQQQQALRTYESSQQQARLKWIEEINGNRMIAEPIFQECRIVDQMRDIEMRYLRKFRKHAVVLDWRFPSTRLIWGESFRITEDGSIGYENRRGGLVEAFTMFRIMEFYDSCVSVDVQTSALNFTNAGKLELHEWRNNPSLVSEKLAASYLNAVRTFDVYTEPEPPAYGDPSTGSF